MTSFHDSVRGYYKMRRSMGYRPEQALRSAKHDARYGFTQDLYTKIETRIQRRKQSTLPPYGKERYDLPGGMYAVIEVEHDGWAEPPWEACDGHGVVSDWEDYDNHDKRWVLHQDRGSARYYDQKATLALAKRDRWGPHPDMMENVRRDFDYLYGWCNDQWHYVVLAATLFDANDEEIAEESCGGIESFAKDYLCSEARSWLVWMLRKHRREVRSAARAAKIASRFRDAMECGV